MTIVTPGYKYKLASFTGKAFQELQFLETRHSADDGVTVEIIDGTTNEEVLSALIDRLTFLQNKNPCRENAIVITKLEESLMWLNKRTSDRKARNVEGTNAK